MLRGALLSWKFSNKDGIPRRKLPQLLPVIGCLASARLFGFSTENVTKDHRMQ